MSINTKMRLTILASAFALVVSAPAAFAQTSGTWYGNTHTDPVTTEGVTSRHSKQLMEQKAAAPAAIASDSGTWYGKIHTDPVTAEGLVTRHSKELMETRLVPSQAAGNKAGESIPTTPY